jgi:hypothetical protein
MTQTRSTRALKNRYLKTLERLGFEPVTVWLKHQCSFTTLQCLTDFGHKVLLYYP